MKGCTQFSSLNKCVNIKMFLNGWFLSFICFYVVSGCHICVNEKLFTSAIKCPICDYIKPHGNQCLPQEKLCNRSAKYRTIDGSCNNLEHHTWGKAETPYFRLLRYNYGDNNFTIASNSHGNEKPLARVLSTKFFPDKGSDDEQASLMALIWGQIVAHDILLTKSQVPTESCCNLKKYKELSKVCLPIKIPPHDRFFSQFNVTCIENSRHSVTHLNDCRKTVAADQVNSNTHFMDGSLIYGSTLDRANTLRQFKHGALKHQHLNKGKEYLPNEQPKPNKRFAAGDGRVNQTPHLAGLQILLLREHNRISHKLHKLNPMWDDEKLYQESRRIVIAILQHISYNEWLPLYVGESSMRKYKLKPTSGSYTEYMNNVKPMILNSFASSVFRFPHSGIQGKISKVNENGKVELFQEITDILNRADTLIRKNHVDQYLLGLAFQPMQAFGNHFAKQITEKLFNNFPPFGGDLASLDIIRGRDHGLAPYIHYLQVCTGQTVHNFDDLVKYIDKSKIDILKRIYEHVNDVDLFVGAALEKMVPSTRFGPTNLCITVEQFYRLKWGDRFWYENKDQPHSFSPAQILEIKKVTLARLICDNGDKITKITPHVFLLASESNRIVKCDTIKKINLRKWS